MSCYKFQWKIIFFSIFVTEEVESTEKDSKAEEEERVIHEDERPSEKSKHVQSDLKQF